MTNILKRQYHEIMKLLVKAGFFFALLFFFSSPLLAISPGDLVINEIMKDPSQVADSEGEWFELYNPTSQAIDLRELEIKDSGTNSITINSSNPVLIPALGFLILGRNSNLAENGGVPIDYQYLGFPLANADDEIIILDGPTEIDRIEYDDGLTWPDPTGASMVLKELGLDNNQGPNWETATAVYGDGDLGTPGEPNFPTPIPTATPTLTPTPSPSPNPTSSSTPTPSSSPIPSYPHKHFIRKTFRYFFSHLPRFLPPWQFWP